MAEFKRTECGWGYRLEFDGACVEVDSETGMAFYFENVALKTPAEARAFAARIIAVADAVEAELKGGK